MELGQGLKKAHDGLKERLLNGELALGDFLNKLMELDQSTPGRIHAAGNQQLLTDPELVEFIGRQPREAQKEYYQLLSLSEFHIGQAKALREGDNMGALEYFEKSLEHDLKGYAFPENVSYKRAVIAYFNNAPVDLEKFAGSGRGNNPKIIANMLKGLKERGFPDYQEDYLI